MAEEFAQETVGPKDGVDWSTQLDKASDQDNMTAPPGSVSFTVDNVAYRWERGRIIRPGGAA